MWLETQTATSDYDVLTEASQATHTYPERLTESETMIKDIEIPSIKQLWNEIPWKQRLWISLGYEKPFENKL